MAYNKIGFHIGTPANAKGYGDYIRALDAAGIPAVCMSTGGEGLGDIISCWDNGSTVQHVAVVRYMPPPGHPDGNQDVPRYDMEEEAAAVRFWAWVKPLIGPDVKRYSQRIVMKMGNELDKAHSEWLAGFYLVLYDIMQSDPDGPFRLAAFGFASGEPEPEHWRGPKMLEYLRLCASDPIGAAICLHEYSYADTLQSGYPFLIGRFQYLFDACNENGIKRPNVYIHEWGWRQDTIPGQAEAMAQLPLAAELYAKYPEVKGAGLWTLQASGVYGDPHISKLVQPMIEPIANYSLTARFPDPPTDPPDDGQGGDMATITVEIEDKDTPYIAFRGWGGRTVERIRHRWIYRTPDIQGDQFTAWTDAPIAIPQNTDVRGLEFLADTTRILSKEVEVPNPNPPPVVSNPLPQGALVVDLSYANDADLAELKDNGVQGVIIRASNGIRTTGSSNINGIDVRFWQYLEAAAALDMPWGSYHYCNENYDDISQVDHFCWIIQEALSENYPPPTLGLWLDFETPDDPIYAGAPTTETRIQALCTALRDLRPLAVEFGPYSSKGWWNGKVPNASAWVPELGMMQWIAAWVPEGDLIDGFPPADWFPANLAGFTAADLRRWQFTPAGGLTVGHAIKSLDLNYEGLPTDSPTPPSQAVDITQYYLPPNGRTYGDIAIKSTNWGQGDVRLQVQLHDGYCYVTKGNEIEKRVIVDGMIFFMLDDSPGDGKYYTVNSPTGWIPALFAPGQTFTRQEVTTFYYKLNCQPTGEVSTWTTPMLFKEFFPEWTSPHGVTVKNVAHLQWLVNGVVEEDYYLAPGLAYVGWKNKAGRESWVKEIIPYTDQEPNKFPGACYHAAVG